MLSYCSVDRSSKHLICITSRHIASSRSFLPRGTASRDDEAIPATAEQFGVRYSMALHQMWHPLDPEKHEIRLLTIESAIRDDDTISCTLSTISLDSDYAYEALSYTWGDQTSQVEILLHGKPWSVTKNLSEALIHFRHTQFPTVMFVDALCTDQSNIAEKNSQVPLMRRIYSQATVVRCWLGLPAVGSDRAMEILRLSSEDQLMEGMVVAARPVDLEDFASLTDLLMRPYWRRAWILQEVVLARQAVFHCGNNRLNSNHLPDYTSLVRSIMSGIDGLSPHNEQSATISSTLLNAVHYYDVLGRTLSRKHKGDLHWPSIEELMTMTAQLTSVPHDHVYAILGTLGPALTWRMVPNYAMSVKDVFQEFAFAYMNLEDSAILLTQSICLRPNSFCLRSWVPDFSTRLLDGVMFFGNLPTVFIENDQAKPNFCMTKEGLLGIDAFCMDFIVDCRRVEVDNGKLRSLDIDTDRALAHHRVWRKFFQLQHLGESLYVGGGEPEEAYWRTMCAGQVSGTSWLLRKHIEACSNWYASGSRSVTPEDEQIAKHFNRDLKLLRKHRLFRTAKGYFGLTCSHSAAQVGDKVFLIAGTANPFLLRRCRAMDDRAVYKLVGAAYVHGTMLRAVRPDHVYEELPAIDRESYVHLHMRIATSWNRVWLA